MKTVVTLMIQLPVVAATGISEMVDEKKKKEQPFAAAAGEIDEPSFADDTVAACTQQQRTDR